MTLNDIITLAKQGYKPADIKELIQMAEGQDDAPQVEQVAISTQSEEPESEETPIVEDAAQAPEVEQSVDYKKLYEEEKKKVETIQQSNVKKNIQGNETSDIDVFNELAKSFM